MRAVLLEDAYRDRLVLTTYDWDEAKSAVARKTYGFGPDHHGLAVLSPDGPLLSVRPGHDYAAKEIREDFDRALKR